MENYIRRLRIIALLLFITPAIGLVGSLLVSNYLSSFNFSPGYNYNMKENLPGNSINYFCSKENNYCSGIKIAEFKEIEKFNKLDKCNIYVTFTEYYLKDGDNLKLVNYEDIGSFDKEFFFKI